MPTSKYFDHVPEFPLNVPVANIPVVSLRLLEEYNEAESEKLYDASQTYGFFALNLSESTERRTVLQQAENMFDLTTSTLSLDRTVLDQYAYKPPHDLLGYKRSGLLKTDDGKVDNIEMYSLGQDDILGNVAARENPETLELQRDTCRNFFQSSYEVLAICLSHLDKHLGLRRGTLAALCPPDKESATSLRLLRSNPQIDATYKHSITLGGHTDIGVITLLFNVVGGLQILPTDDDNLNENWKYIQPKPNCAIINIGDTLVEWTGGVLRSSLHRVVAAPGEQAKVPRQSLAYLVRPENNATMRRLRSNVILEDNHGKDEEIGNVKEWAARRAKEIMNGELKPHTRGGKLMVRTA